MRTAKTGQNGQMPRLIRVFAGSRHRPFCWFCHALAQIHVFILQRDVVSWALHFGNNPSTVIRTPYCYI